MGASLWTPWTFLGPTQLLSFSVMLDMTGAFATMVVFCHFGHFSGLCDLRFLSPKELFCNYGQAVWCVTPLYFWVIVTIL